MKTFSTSTRQRSGTRVPPRGPVSRGVRTNDAQRAEVRDILHGPRLQGTFVDGAPEPTCECKGLDQDGQILARPVGSEEGAAGLLSPVPRPRLQAPGDTIQRYTASDIATCPCLDWSLVRMHLTAEAMVTGGQFTGRPHAAAFMDLFLSGNTSDQYVLFSTFQANPGGQTALDNVNALLLNQFLAEADALPCGDSTSGLTKRASTPGHFSSGTDLFYAMGAFTLRAEGTGTVSKSCDEDGNCEEIAAEVDILYRVDDLYDWKADPGGCTPATGESGCTPNMKTVTLPVIGKICDECLNRLVIHGWAAEFMVKVRGLAEDYRVAGPCGFRNPTEAPEVRDNQREDA